MLAIARSVRDKLRFLLATEWVYIVAAVGVLMAIAPYLLPGGRIIPLVIAVVGLILTAVMFLRDTGVLIARWSAWELTKLPEVVTGAGGLTVPHLPVKVATGRGTVAISPDIDRALVGCSANARLSSFRYVLPLELAEVAPYALRFGVTGKWLFNGPNLGLQTEMVEAELLSGTDITVIKGDYFSFVCSDELMSMQVRHNDARLRLREKFLFDSRGGGHVAAIGTTGLNHCIGVSTLAITTDQQVVLTRQARRSQASGGLWAPSGSGTVEPRDMQAASATERDRTETPTKFVDLITRAAERELCEETQVSPEQIRGTEVVGYGRWIERGAKPEFFCVTTLNIAAGELRLGSNVHRRFSDERMWTHGVYTHPLATDAASMPFDAPETGGLRQPLWRQARVLEQPEDLDDAISVPLDLALDAWARRRVNA